MTMTKPEPTQTGHENTIRVVGLGGSLRPNSYSQQLLALAGQQVDAQGAAMEILDLRTLNLPFCHGGKDYSDYPDVARLQQTVKAADAVILSTPEYHGGVSGVLKNALDLMSFEELEGKVFGVMSVLGGQPNSNALNDLRLIIRWVHGFVIPEQVAVGQAWKAFDDQGNLVDEKLAERVDTLARSLVETATRLRRVMA